ncbi:hypothetical protein [Shimia abyssi]|uniref:Uncharacterized protein n=1 Tax=Shimia abyssi TaxID=1662395 RepID=A0A2P8F9T0_9RHOB|nr:hypothetical protein [Shimia abyssi]PSL18469.1 hypothetical protein CLV88_11046 [Shimia abyssi]
MFIGHYGIALGTHALIPAAPLPAVFLATQSIDIVWSSLVLAGVEKVEIRPGATATTPLNLYYMPYSHSLLGACVISLACAGLALGAGLTGAVALVIFAVALSHWFLDLIVHVHTLSILPHGRKVGFGLWQNRPASIILEFALILGGMALYWSAFAPLKGASGWLFLAVCAFALFAQAMSFFGKPPKNKTALCLTILGVFTALTLASFWMNQT